MAGNKKAETEIQATEESSVIKKPLIKNNTLFALILVIGVLAAVAIFGISFVKNRISGGDSGSGSAQQTWQKIADNLTYMIESADLQIVYKSSDKRNIIYLIGSNGYYSVQYNNNKIYVNEGTYTNTAVTDEQKITEANSKITTGQQVYASDVSSFTVDTSNAKTIDQDFWFKDSANSYSAGTVSITFGIDQNSVNKRDTFSVTIQ